jgi:hypothetical protein
MSGADQDLKQLSFKVFHHGQIQPGQFINVGANAAVGRHVPIGRNRPDSGSGFLECGNIIGKSRWWCG